MHKKSSPSYKMHHHHSLVDPFPELLPRVKSCDQIQTVEKVQKGENNKNEQD